MALTREKVELEIYKEDELFEESSDEEGDLLIKSAFEEEEGVGAKKLKVEEATEPKENGKKLWSHIPLRAISHFQDLT